MRERKKAGHTYTSGGTIEEKSYVISTARIRHGGVLRAWMEGPFQKLQSKIVKKSEVNKRKELHGI